MDRQKFLFKQFQLIIILIDKPGYSMFLFNSCLQTAQVICGTFQKNAIFTGVTDVIIVKHQNDIYKSTPFLISFGPYKITHSHKKVQVYVNDDYIPEVKFQLDHKGYTYPHKLSNQQIKSLNLKLGVNKVTYKIQDFKINAQIYLYTDNDKLIVSDVDGTVTKSDIRGHFHNYFGKDYLHAGYAELVQKLDQSEYKIVWLTMRALPLYQYSKKYLKQTCKINAPILMQPQEFMNAFINEVTKKTGNIKANMIKCIGKLFEKNPFQAGLGNRQGDAVAYYHGGICLSKIFIIDKKSRVHQMKKGSCLTTYKQIAKKIQNYFPFKPQRKQHQ